MMTIAVGETNLVLVDLVSRFGVSFYLVVSVVFRVISEAFHPTVSTILLQCTYNLVAEFSLNK